ncbi:hypothetical protein ISCGN_003196 [Ixodes scapularis]
MAGLGSPVLQPRRLAAGRVLVDVLLAPRLREWSGVRAPQPYQAGVVDLVEGNPNHLPPGQPRGLLRRRRGLVLKAARVPIRAVRILACLLNRCLLHLGAALHELAGLPRRHFCLGIAFVLREVAAGRPKSLLFLFLPLGRSAGLARNGVGLAWNSVGRVGRNPLVSGLLGVPSSSFLLFLTHQFCRCLHVTFAVPPLGVWVGLAKLGDGRVGRKTLVFSHLCVPSSHFLLSLTRLSCHPFNACCSPRKSLQLPRFLRELELLELVVEPLHFALVLAFLEFPSLTLESPLEFFSSPLASLLVGRLSAFLPLPFANFLQSLRELFNADVFGLKEFYNMRFAFGLP